MRKSLLATLLATTSIAATALVAVPAAHAADDYYLKINGVAGETAVGKVPDAIKVSSFQWNAENPTSFSSATGGTAAGKAALKELKIEKRVDSTSPVLFEKLTTGTMLNGMELVAVRVTATGTPQIVQRYFFYPAFVTAQNHTGDVGGEGAKESVTFGYGGVQMTTTRLSTTLKPTTVSATWSQITNTNSLALPGLTTPPSLLF